MLRRPQHSCTQATRCINVPWFSHTRQIPSAKPSPLKPTWTHSFIPFVASITPLSGSKIAGDPDKQTWTTTDYILYSFHRHFAMLRLSRQKIQVFTLILAYARYLIKDVKGPHKGTTHHLRARWLPPHPWRTLTGNSLFTPQRNPFHARKLLPLWPPHDKILDRWDKWSCWRWLFLVKWRQSTILLWRR